MYEWEYSAKKVNKFNLISLYNFCKDFYECGKDITSKYDINHLNNSYLT